MKVCERCKYVHLSRQEKEVLKLLPSTSVSIAETKEWSRQHAYAILTDLERLEVIERLGQIDGQAGIVFDAIRKEKVFKLDPDPSSRAYEEILIKKSR